MSKCRDCGEQIEFVTLRSGKKMPVESAEPEEYRVWLEDPGGLESRQLVLVTGDGTVLTVYQGLEPLRFGDDPCAARRVLDGPCKIVGVESHFQYCGRAR